MSKEDYGLSTYPQEQGKGLIEASKVLRQAAFDTAMKVGEDCLEPPKFSETDCTCGAESVGSFNHSSWCK